MRRKSRRVRRKSRRVSPSGPRSGDPLGKGRESRPFIYCPTGRVGAPPAVSDSTSCLAKTTGHPWPAPFGLFPVGRLACATGPEGDTRRLFRRLRWRGVEPTLASIKRTAGLVWEPIHRRTLNTAIANEAVRRIVTLVNRSPPSPPGLTRLHETLRVRRRSRLLHKTCVTSVRAMTLSPQSTSP